MNNDAKKRYKEIDFPFTCPISNRTFDSGKGLSIYVTKTLKSDHEEYYNKYINHRDSTCYFCSGKGTFISISRGYRNLCESEECKKKSFSSHSVEGFMYRKFCSREEAEILFNEENNRQLELRTETQKRLRNEDPLWDKKRSRNCKEFWIQKGLTIEESELKVKEVMNEIHEKTFKKFKDDPEKYASKQPTRIEYYIKRGFSGEDAKKALTERQKTFSLKICEEKYGKEIGKDIWINRQEKWQESLFNNGNIKGGYSKISQILFWDIIKSYKKDDIDNVFFWMKNRERFFRSKDNKIYLYDFMDIKRKKIIEYNGDQYHANPNTYLPSDTPHPYHKEKEFIAEKIWEKDRVKANTAIENGYEILVIWDSEYRKYPEQTLEKCIKFIKE